MFDSEFGLERPLHMHCKCQAGKECFLACKMRIAKQESFRTNYGRNLVVHTSPGNKLMSLKGVSESVPHVCLHRRCFYEPFNIQSGLQNVLIWVKDGQCLLVWDVGTVIFQLYGFCWTAFNHAGRLVLGKSANFAGLLKTWEHLREKPWVLQSDVPVLSQCSCSYFGIFMMPLTSRIRPSMQSKLPKPRQFRRGEHDRAIPQA